MTFEMWLFSFLGIVMVALGVFITKKTEVLWKITEEWKSYRADGPSDFYLLSTKIGGIFLIIAGVIFIILPFVLR